MRAADVVITITGSKEPVFKGEWLSPGTHVNAAGVNFADKRELDAETLRRASHIVADSVEVARLDSGDLILNEFDWERLGELGDIVAGKADGRSSSDEITVFESHGMALEDLACAVRVLKKAQATGDGFDLPI